MSDAMNFDQLVEFCRLTHEEIQKQAVRAVDHTLVVRNWLFGRYYEIETAANQWSVRELERQISTSLYQRLALSRDNITGRIRQLAERYATPLPQLTEEVATLAARVDGHLKRMGAEP